MIFKLITYTSAIALVAFSGAVSTYGLTHFAPGAEWVIFIMGALFEVGKLVALALMHRLPWNVTGFALRIPLLALSVVLMGLNVIGVSGFLSNNFEREMVKAEAANHTSTASAQADVDLLERQVAAAEQALVEANKQLVAAKGNTARIAAANANISAKTKDRDGLMQRLGVAKRAMATTEGAKIESTGEVAAITNLAATLHLTVRETARYVFIGVAFIPELLAFLLMIAVEMGNHSRQQSKVTASVVFEDKTVPAEPAVNAEVEQIKQALAAAQAKADQLEFAKRSQAARRGVETKNANKAKASQLAAVQATGNVVPFKKV